MPRKYVSRRPRLRRKGGRKGYRSGARRVKRGVPQTLIQRAPTGHPFPQRYLTKLRYVSEALSHTTGNTQDRVFRGNSLFDPDLTGVGHQPRGFDQLAGLYNVYRVLGSRCTIRAVPRDATAGSQNLWYAAVPSLDGASLSAVPYYDIREMPYSKSKFRTLYNGPVTLKKYMSTAQIEGRKKSVIRADNDFSAPVTGNPDHQWYWHVVMGTMDNLSLLNVTYYIEIDYYVAFENRKQLSVS